MTETCGPTDTPADIDIDALREKYAQERAKRLRPEGADQYLELEGEFAEFYEIDPYTTVTARDPIVENAEVVILGGGFAGLLAGAHLKKAGVQGIRVIEMAGDFDVEIRSDPEEIEEPELNHLPCRSWCDWCVMGRGHEMGHSSASTGNEHT